MTTECRATFQCTSQRNLHSFSGHQQQQLLLLVDTYISFSQLILPLMFGRGTLEEAVVAAAKAPAVASKRSRRWPQSPQPQRSRRPPPRVRLRRVVRLLRLPLDLKVARFDFQKVTKKSSKRPSKQTHFRKKEPKRQKC